jgi:hypothetical protein
MIDKDFLIDRYVNKKLPINEIVKELKLRSCGYIYYCLKVYDIPKRNRTLNMKITKEFLEEHYIKFRKPAKVIAREFNIRPSTLVTEALKSFNIPRINTNKIIRSKEGLHYVGTRYYKALIRRAIKSRIEFNISKEYIVEKFKEQNGLCALSGIKIYFTHICNKQGLVYQTASLDRIDSSKGYIVGNVQWVHKHINKMKMNLSDHDFINWCKVVTKYNDNNIS